jgi:CRISPR-associated endonuclease Cas1
MDATDRSAALSLDAADASELRTAAFARNTSADGICVVDGMGVRLYVERGALVIEDGMGEDRRNRRFDKATHGLQRVVVCAATGNWTIDALHWCRRLGVGVLVLAPDGTAVLCTTPRVTDDARLRRMQAAAPTLPVGLDIARWLTAEKLQGQARLLAQRFDDAGGGADTIEQLATAAITAETIEELRTLESSGASLYFQSWVGRPECVPRFVAKDRARIPPHWTRYEGRRSVLSSANSNRKSERPTNSLANYLYALVEAEATLACKVAGLDEGLGIVHSDMRGRASMACDLMEAARPHADAYLLDLLSRRTFRKVEFVETDEGHCRLRPGPLTHELAETLPRWKEVLAPVAEHIAHALGRAMAGKYDATTPLTRNRARTAQSAIRARRAATRAALTSTAKRQQPAATPSLTLWSCPKCGSPVENPRRVRCDACIATDPRHTDELRGKRGAAIAARKRALRQWEDAHPGVAYDPSYFQREILPRLVDVKLRDIMETAGVSKSYASAIRSGKHTPHVSAWVALANLVGTQPPSDAFGGEAMPSDHPE